MPERFGLPVGAVDNEGLDATEWGIFYNNKAVGGAVQDLVTGANSGFETSEGGNACHDGFAKHDSIA